MAKKPNLGAVAPICIDASSPAYNNWRLDAAPPVIVNPQADIHALAAWCWGEVRDLELIASINPDSMSPLALVLGSRLPALVGVLERLGEMTLAEVEGSAA